MRQSQFYIFAKVFARKFFLLKYNMKINSEATVRSLNTRKRGTFPCSQKNRYKKVRFVPNHCSV